MLPADGLPAGGVPDGGLLAGGAASPLAGLEALDGLLDAPPNFTFFRTKLPPAALLELALLDGLLAVSLDDPLARCRQPVALAVPAVALAGDWGLDAVGDCGFGVVGDWGFGVVGLCAAIVPHSATAVLSVTAHRH